MRTETTQDIANYFYSAFQKQDAEKMVQFYADNIRFEDPAFGKLKGVQTKNMWRMLCKNATDLKIDYKITAHSTTEVRVYWEAKYTFSKTGRRIHNKIHATLTFENLKIIDHKDDFNLWKWSIQAFGISGVLIGWTPFFRKKIQSSTHKLLEKFSLKY